MKKRMLSHGEVSDFCTELSLLSHAGIGTADGLYLLAEESEGEDAALLTSMAGRAEEGAMLSAVMEETGVFPAYAVEMVRAGERSGRQEESFQGLADSYEGQERMERQIRTALLYPSILLMLMLVVLVVLLAKVLPVFDQVFSQMGGGLTGLAGGLLSLGLVLNAGLPVLCAVLVVVVALLAAFSLSAGLRTRLGRWWNRSRGEKGISRKIAMARFAAALSMGLRSGLSVEEALDMAAPFAGETAAAAARAESCRTLLAQGNGLAQALQKSNLLPAAPCRMLALGLRSGSGDSVMAEIARRMQEEAEQSIQTQVSRVEPTMVIVTSLLVGVILLSVMLPLVHIMSAL